MKASKAPTTFRLMVSRYASMVQAARGYDCLGTVTVRFDGHHYLQTGRSDDPGIMELIPTLSRLSSMSLATTYDVTIVVFVGVGILVGYFGFLRIFPDLGLGLIGAAIFLCIGLAELSVADEYAFQISPLIAGIPWLFHFANIRRPRALTVSAVSLAFCCACCSLVRTGTVSVCMTFLVVMFLLRQKIQRPFFPIMLLCLVCVLPALFERSLIARRNAALSRVGEPATGQDTRPLWHTAYIGLGFIPNPEVSEYRDGIAAEKVRSIDPTVSYTSKQYEVILRREMWRIFKQNPMIIMQNAVAKLGIIAMLGIVMLFPARRFIFSDREVLWFDISLFASAGLSAINAIVAVPKPPYLLTFTCLLVQYSAIKFCLHQRAITGPS